MTTSLVLLALIAAPSPTAAEAFTTLQALVGDWEAPVAGSAVDGGAPRMAKVSYRLISGGSVLVETWGVAAPTMTMVHLDGKNLVATHYCGQGNQPRLRMTSATSSSIVFEYWDATNLSSADQSHMVRLELVLVGANQFTHKEVYASGKKRDADELTFTRVTPSR